jgi:hypothetical protein
VKGVNIKNHIRAFSEAAAAGIPFDCESVPEELKKYPARGNPYWSKYYDFDLPNDTQGLELSMMPMAITGMIHVMVITRRSK